MVVPRYKLTVEYFYRALNNAKYEKPTKLSNDKSIEIAGHKCSTGTFMLDGISVKFYYTNDDLGIISPLNAYISPELRINVMAILYPTSGHTAGELSTILFKIEEVVAQKLDDSMFKLPGKSSITSVDSMKEINFSGFIK